MTETRRIATFLPPKCVLGSFVHLRTRKYFWNNKYANLHTVASHNFTVCAYQHVQHVFCQSHFIVVTLSPPRPEQCWSFHGCTFAFFFETVRGSPFVWTSDCSKTQLYILFYVLFFFRYSSSFQTRAGHCNYNNNPTATFMSLQITGFAPVILQVYSVGRLLSSTAGCTLYEHWTNSSQHSGTPMTNSQIIQSLTSSRGTKHQSVSHHQSRSQSHRTVVSDCSCDNSLPSFS
jgi:hypothetical protein